MSSNGREISTQRRSAHLPVRKDDEDLTKRDSPSVELSDLSDEDRALARLGYKPVCFQATALHRILTCRCLSVNFRRYLRFHLLFLYLACMPLWPRHSSTPWMRVAALVSCGHG